MRRLLLPTVVLILAASLQARQADSPRIEDVLRAAADYLKGYERNLALVAQEEYTQQITLGRRMLQSDILFMQDDTFGWVEYRDVAMMDRLPVRDRQARLLALFTKPNPDRLKQAQTIVTEGARFNLDPPGTSVQRTINLPLTGARFLRGPDQGRSSFRITAWDRRTGVVTVEFNEERLPRLIRTPDQGAAHGRFEIDRASGRLLASSVTVQSYSTTATIAVRFGPEAKLDMWVPLSMDEEYHGNFNGRVTGIARYSHYRQFKVETTTDIR